MREADRPFFLMVNYFDPHVQSVDQVEGIPAEPITPERLMKAEG